MTIDEAIKQLEINKKDDTYVIDDEALDMAIKALQESSCEDAVSRKDMYFKLTNGAYPNETTEQFIDRLVKELEDMPPVTPTKRWIPVSERLPEKEGLYLVSVKNEHDRRYSKTCWFHGDGNWFARQDVDAWMPLPKSYKVEKRNNK